jgi:hypothetical protein
MMSGNRWFWILSFLFMTLFIIGVVMVIALANRPFPEYDIVSPTALPRYDPFMETQAAQQRQTDAALNPDACGWMWNTEVHPELSGQLQQQLRGILTDAGAVEARVETFGENCLNWDGSVRYFAAMKTDFRIIVWIYTLPVANADAVQPLVSEMTQTILMLLEDYPFDTAPGRQPGNIYLEFPALVVHHRTTYWLSTDYQSAMNALNQGLTGKALLDALGGLRQQDEVLPT